MRWHTSEAPSSWEGPGLWAQNKFLGICACKGQPPAAALVCGTPAAVGGKALLAPKEGFQDRNCLHPPAQMWVLESRHQGCMRALGPIVRCYPSSIYLAPFSTRLDSHNSSWVRFKIPPSSLSRSYILTHFLCPSPALFFQKAPISNILISHNTHTHTTRVEDSKGRGLYLPFGCCVPSAQRVAMGVTIPCSQGCAGGTQVVY